MSGLALQSERPVNTPGAVARPGTTAPANSYTVDCMRMESRELRCVFARVVSHFEDSGRLIGRLQDGQCVIGQAKPEQLSPGIAYTFLGRWTEHYRWGKQF